MQQEAQRLFFNIFVLSSFLKVAGTHALVESFKQVRILSCVFAVWHARWHTSLNKVFIHVFLLKRKSIRNNSWQA
nr:MAG TPA: hypothetical protein [Caudoviricetes sp.]